MSAAEALEAIDAGLGQLEELPERAEDFAHDAQDFFLGVRETIERTSHVTDRQEEAIENTLAGIAAWLERA